MWDISNQPAWLRFALCFILLPIWSPVNGYLNTEDLPWRDAGIFFWDLHCLLLLHQRLFFSCRWSSNLSFFADNVGKPPCHPFQPQQVLLLVPAASAFAISPPITTVTDTTSINTESYWPKHSVQRSCTSFKDATMKFLKLRILGKSIGPHWIMYAVMWGDKNE